VGKDKLKRWKELEEFKNVIQPGYNELVNKDHYLKGHWNELYFKNRNPIVLELGCGKGEYTVGLAKENFRKNYIGIDIKGARLWRGAKTAHLEKLTNVAFLRTRMENLGSLFGTNEVEEIWLTFPDPRMKKKDVRKRLTSTRFLNLYKQFLCKAGILNLKTDNFDLFNYTRKTLKSVEAIILDETEDLYGEPLFQQAKSIQTYYEKKFLEKNQPIYYLRFRLPQQKFLEEFPDE